MSASKAKSVSGKSTPGGDATLLLATPKYEGVSPSTLPFPEWSDAELNAEKWELPKVKDKPKPVKKGEEPPPPPPPAFYEDPHAVRLPPSLANEEVEWKRPFEIFPNMPLVIYKEASGYTELKCGSQHLIDSEFIRSFISAIHTLEFLGYMHPSAVEFATPVYTPNNGDEPWQPWHHVYSACKAGKGQKHKPIANQLEMDMWSKWDLCLKYADNFKWPDETTTSRPGSAKSGKSGKSAKSDKSSKSGKSDKKTKTLIPVEKIITYTVVAACTEIAWQEETPINLAPCLSHLFLIDQVRNIPLERPDPNRQLPLWKTYRWLEWAIEKGLWVVDDYTNLRSAKIVSNFKNYPALERDEGPPIADAIPAGSAPPSERSSKKGKKVAKVIPPNPSYWEDFNEIAPYISHLYIFFKASLYTSSATITDVAKKADKGGKPTGNEPIFVQWTKDVRESRNDAVYLLIESMKEITMTINLSQVGNMDALVYDEVPEEEAIDTVEEEEEEENETLECSKSEETIVDAENIAVQEDTEYKNFDVDLFHRPFAHLIVEHCHWQQIEIGDILGTINTNATKCGHLHLKSGRYLLRLWIKSDVSFVVNVAVSCPMTIGHFEQMLGALTKEAEGMIKLSDRIGGAFNDLVLSFGMPTFGDCLRKFYASYLPNEWLTKHESYKLHTTFFDEMVNLIRINSPPNDLRQNVALIRILFLQPITTGKIRTKICEDDDHLFCICEPIDETEDPDAEWAAYKIQAFFKLIYLKKMLAYHKKTHKQFKQNMDGLKKIYGFMFDPNRRLTTVPSIMRTLLANAYLADVAAKYEYLRGFRNVIDLKQYTGSLFSVDNCWLPLCRQTFTLTAGDVVKIGFFCDLTKFIVRVFNNDTLEELDRFTNNTRVMRYGKNETGYTVLCYGWSLIAKPIMWKLSLITLKNNNPTIIMQPQIYLNNDVLIGNYLPNAYNYICRCLINTNEDLVTTIRLSVSYPEVKLKLRCLDENNKVLVELAGVENIILPLANLIIQSNPSSTSLQSRQSSRTSTNTNKTPRKTHSDFTGLKKRSNTGRESVRSGMSTNRRLSSRESSLAKPLTIFCIEGIVLNDSWPLLKDEWEIVEDLRNKGLYRPSKFRSINSISAKSEMSSRKSSGSRKISYTAETIQSPFWCLQTVSDKRVSISAAIDHRREEEILLLKRSWYENDPNRLRESMLLRENYLYNTHEKWENLINHFEDSISKEISRSTENSQHSSKSLRSSKESDASKVLSVLKASSISRTSTGTDAKEPTASASEQTSDLSWKFYRTLIKPVSKSKILPPFDLHDWPWMESEPDVKKIIKTPEYYEMLKVENEEKEAQFNAEQEEFHENLTCYMQERQRRNQILTRFFDECRKESAQMMKEVYDLRETYKKNKRPLKK